MRNPSREAISFVITGIATIVALVIKDFATGWGLSPLLSWTFAALTAIMMGLTVGVLGRNYSRKRTGS